MRATALTYALLFCAAVCYADNLAMTPVGGTAGTDTRPFMIGWEFSTSATVTVSGLAYLDTTGAGLNEAHTVGIFNASSGTLLVSATVPAGASATYLNGFRVVPVSYTLPAGTYVIGGQKNTSADSSIEAASSVSSGSSAVQYIQERELQTSSFTMPTTNFQPNEAGSFGPDFTIAGASGSPSITSLSNSASYQPSFAGNTYISVYGTNLAVTTRTWQASDFKNGTNLPISLDGVSATVNGVSAYVEYVSPGQINLITPNLPQTGTGIPVVVTTPAGPTVSSWVTIQPISPAFFTWITNTPDSGKYLVAQHAASYTNVGKTGLYPNSPPNFTTPAVPGETIILYGTGFGATSPAIAQGIITDKIYPLSPTPTATIGGLPAQVTFAGLVPPLSQVYQFNITVPASVPNGDQTLLVTVGGVKSVPGLITIHN